MTLPAEHVKLTSVPFVADIQETFGLPAIQKDRDELFGPYHLVHSAGFLKYKASSDSWDYVRLDELGIPKTSALAGYTKDERYEIDEKMALVAFAPPEDEPSDPTTVCSLPKFWFEGYWFAWKFIPELRRWEVAVLPKA